MEDGFYTDNMKWIYLTPIFQAASDHKYNTTDYQRIDEDFGTEDIFKELVDTAHDLGIRVMIDAVFNHSGREFFAWQDSIQWLQGDEYDSVMNYPFMKSINIFFSAIGNTCDYARNTVYLLWNRDCNGWKVWTIQQKAYALGRY